MRWRYCLQSFFLCKYHSRGRQTVSSGIISEEFRKKEDKEETLAGNDLHLLKLPTLMHHRLFSNTARDRQTDKLTAREKRKRGMFRESEMTAFLFSNDGCSNSVHTFVFSSQEMQMVTLCTHLLNETLTKETTVLINLFLRQPATITRPEACSMYTDTAHKHKAAKSF